MLLRDHDASADGTYEVRRGVLQNWRADVSCIIEDDGKVIEWVRYTSYGVAYSIMWVSVDFNGNHGVKALDASDNTTDIGIEAVKEHRYLQTYIGSKRSAVIVRRMDIGATSRSVGPVVHGIVHRPAEE